MAIPKGERTPLYETATERGMDFILAERLPNFIEAHAAQAEYHADVDPETGRGFYCRIVVTATHYQIWVGPQERKRIPRCLPNEKIRRATRALRTRIRRGKSQKGH